MRNALEKAKRHLDDARTIVEGVKQENGYYADRKSIKRAGRLAYKGIMIALNKFLGLANKNEHSISWYERKLAEIDSMQSMRFYSLYCTLSLSMGFDGILLPSISAVGLEEANEFIEWIENKSVAT